MGRPTYPLGVNPTDVFVKRESPTNPGATAYEAAGLRWLEKSGAPTVRILHEGRDYLELERIRSVQPTSDTAHRLGQELAWMHASGAPGYGAAPGTYNGPGWMGRAPLSLIPTRQFNLGKNPKTGHSWGSFYASMRLRPYITDVFSPSQKQAINEVCELLESGALDHREPDLVRERRQAASRIHGDLWSGNVMWSKNGAVLIDPAAQGGHAEEDLAALALFGAPNLGSILEGYQSVSPLAPGWQGRVGLHQLHILIVHCYLFGRSYVPDFMGRVHEILGANDTR